MRFIRHPQVASYFFLGICALLPLVFWPYTHIISEFPKTLVFEAATLILCVFLLSLWMNGKLSIPVRLQFLGRSILLALSVFLVFAVLSTLFSIDPLLSFWGTYYRYQGLLHILFLALFFAATFILGSDKTFLEKAGKAISLGSIPIVLYAFLQLGGVDPVFNHLDASQFFGRIFSLLGNPNYLAQYLVFVIPLTGYFFLRSRDVWKKFFGILFILQTAVLLLTESRAGQLGFLFALVALFIFLIAKRRSKRARIGLTALLLVPVLVVGFFIFTDIKVPLFTRWLPIGESAGSVQARFALWDIAGRAISDKSLLGFGPETFVHVVDTYQTEALPPYTGIPDRAHNFLLDNAVSYGFFGMISLLLAVLLSLFVAFRSEKEFSAALGSSVLGLFVAYQFGFMTTVDGMLFVFAIAAISALSARSSAPLLGVQARSVRFCLISVSAIAALVGIFFFHALPFRADQLFQRGVTSLAAHKPFPALRYFEEAALTTQRHRPFYFYQGAHRILLYAKNQAQQPKRKQILLERAVGLAEKGFASGGAKREFDEISRTSRILE